MIDSAVKVAEVAAAYVIAAQNAATAATQAKKLIIKMFNINKEEVVKMKEITRQAHQLQLIMIMMHDTSAAADAQTAALDAEIAALYAAKVAYTKSEILNARISQLKALKTAQSTAATPSVCISILETMIASAVDAARLAYTDMKAAMSIVLKPPHPDITACDAVDAACIKFEILNDQVKYLKALQVALTPVTPSTSSAADV